MSKTEEFEVPDEWGLSEQQEFVIGSLIDERGKYVPPFELCNELYDEEYEAGAPAPAKLRVLMQRCRDIVADLTSGRVEIETRRGKGWRITKRARIILMKAVED